LDISITGRSVFPKIIGKVLPKFDLYKGFFLEKNGPNSPSFEESQIQFARFL
jgi:hypothetical protein